MNEVDRLNGKILDHVVNGDWSAFWSALSPRAACEALKAAPNVAGPWEEWTGGRYRRWSRIDGVVVDSEEDGSWRCRVLSRANMIAKLHDQPAVADVFDTREAADVALRAAGWLLVDDEGDKGTNSGEGRK